MAVPKIVILSIDRVQRYEPEGVEVCISITDPRAPPAQVSPRFADVLRLEFTDIAAEAACGAEDVLFAPEHAERILDFLAQWPNAERVVVHCVAGASRSPGVALGLCDVHGWPTDAIERAKPFWNSWVRGVFANCRRPGAVAESGPGEVRAESSAVDR